MARFIGCATLCSMSDRREYIPHATFRGSNQYMSDPTVDMMGPP